MNQQQHPLHGQDRTIVDRLLASTVPSDIDLIDCARLMIRYRGFPGAPDIKADITAAMQRWGLTPQAVVDQARSLWSTGWRPLSLEENDVGSGADVAAG